MPTLVVIVDRGLRSYSTSEEELDSSMYVPAFRAGVCWQAGVSMDQMIDGPVQLKYVLSIASKLWEC